MALYDSPYQIGGSLQLNSPTYVTRRADRDLYAGLSAGHFCYVLNCRQMGKSSLRVQTMARLQAAGVACVAVQMTDIIDEEITPEQFYAGVIDSITQDLELDFDNMAWWEANGGLSLVNRFSKFLETVLLQRVAGKVVIFIDEIDRVLSLPFKVNGFFAAIRECYNKRADNPMYRRLTFSLLGVATPSDLIEDKRSTPFNIGQAIELHGFTLSEARPLAQGLRVANPTAMLAAILHWTGGQPFLTQKVCRLVANHTIAGAVAEGAIADWVDSLVRSQVIHNWAANDEPEHLRTIRDRLLHDEHRAARRLGLYQQILAQGSLPTNRANADHIGLRLSGLVVEQSGQLRIYNAIYAAIFNAEWAVRKLADLRPYTKAIDVWLESDRTDKSHLLQGGALTKAKQWSEDKVLPPEDYAFLAASQELVTEETEEARQTLARANRTLEEANYEATVRMDSANRRLRIGTAILLGTIALFAFTVFYSKHQVVNAETKSEQALADAKDARGEKEAARSEVIAAEQEVKEAEEKGKRIEAKGKEIKQASQRQSEAARAEVEQAAVQAQQAQAQTQRALVATEQAEKQQELAQKSADEAQNLTNHAQASARFAQQDATQAQQDVAIARKGQETIRAGISLERRATALWRNPSTNIRGLDTLIDALTIAQDVNLLLLSSPDPQKTVAFTSEYPEVSRSLRTSINSVLGTTKFKGSFRAFSKEGQRLVTFSAREDTSWLYDLSGQPLAEFKGSEPSFSEDGQWLVTSSREAGTSWLYDLSGRLLAEFKGSFSEFSKDGQRLITFSDEAGTSWLYDLSGQQLAEFKGSFSEFSEDGQQLVTDVADKDISRIYDTAGTLLAEFPGSVHSDQDEQLGFTPDDKHLFTRTNDGDYHLWQLDNGLDDLIAQGCDWVRPYLQANPEETRADFCK